MGRALDELEAQAARGADAAELLARVEDLGPTLRGTSFEARLRELEARLLERKREREREQQVARALEDARKILNHPKAFERKADVVSLLRAVRPVAGPRLAEVDRLIHEAECLREEPEAVSAPAPPPPPAVPAPPPANGLTGTYFDDIDFTSPRVTRVDSRIFFDWAKGSPDPSIAPDTFSVRWTGQVQPRYSETYTFYVQSDDGARLWVNGRLIIDNWVDQGFIEKSGTLTLSAGQRYDLRLEYYEQGGAAAIWLSWSSPRQPKEIIPPSQLFPASSSLPPAQDGRRVIARETFEQGPGPFGEGTVVEGGWNGSRALAVPAKGVFWEKLFTRPVSPTLTIRFLLKPLFDARQVEVIFWSPKRRQNYRYHLRNLRPQEWNRVEFRVAEARIGWNLEGPSAEGDIPDNFGIYFDDKVADGRLLLDDFEILE